MQDQDYSTGKIAGFSTAAILLLFGFIVLFMWGCPQYRVYSQRKEGEAQLAHAQASKEVAVAEARAKMESAALLAQADTIRAHGVARSNQIIGASLKGNPEYLHWLWIDNIEKNPQAVIYVPTEANLPILEAGKRRHYNDSIQ
jgi:regulator of protease activity HflC (stomatin/prohibitin superfamily)